MHYGKYHQFKLGDFMMGDNNPCAIEVLDETPKLGQLVELNTPIDRM